MLSSQMPSSFQAIIRRGLIMLAAMILLAEAGGRALAVDDTFFNDTLYNSIGNISATNVVNDFGGTFSVTPGLGSGWLADLYQAWHYTRNFTNNGEMDSNTGFRFDTQTTIHTEAANFYNAGNINCGTGLGAIFLINGSGVFLNLGGFGGIFVWATNVINSGTVTLGTQGLAKFSGNNLDFTRGTVTMQNLFLNILGQTNIFTNSSTIFATGQTGKNTNDWFPDITLRTNSASTSFPPLFAIRGFPGFTTTLLPATTPYFSVVDDGTGTNRIIRMVFIQNDFTNVPYNIYFGSGFGNGFTTIEWVGSFTDPASGQPVTHYLYMTDDYVQGSVTNILSYTGVGVPPNYGFFEFGSQLPLGAPEPVSFPSLFPPGQPFPQGFAVSSNIYSYVNAQLQASTVSTNSVVNGAVTNLPGRVELVASNELNLSLSSMSGMNYLLLRSTNNYDNDGQSLISSAYSDVYLGRTNGTLVVSNLLVSSIPIWGGSIQGWNSRWIYSDTNAGINYDYRVLLVESALIPVSASEQQDVMLYSSNNLTISDTFNVFRSFYINCTNLLLSQNPPGNMAASFQGELNLGPLATWAASTPRLRELTNNGAIRSPNIGKYGSPALPYIAFVNTGTVSNGAGALITAGDFENSGNFTAGSGSFIVNSTYTIMTNGSITAAGVFSNNSAVFVASNTVIQSGKAFTILATNILTDGGTTNNFWSLGTLNGGLGTAPGLSLPLLPPTASLLGTTITNPSVPGTLVNDVWSGADYGAVNAGFNNNAAIGQLILDAQGANPHTAYYFAGSSTNGVTNTMYVDCLQLHHYASYTNRTGTNLTGLSFNTNLVIYYAQALIDDGSSVAEKINHFNGNHLRWVPSYAGIFSSTNLIYPDGTTNTVNAALAGSPDIDSDGDGTANNTDPSPILTPSQLNFTIIVTNLPPKSAKIQWITVGNGTNYIYYKTNLLSPGWLPLTSFKNFYYDPGQSGTNGLHTNWFASPLGYSTPPSPVWIYDPVTNVQRYYQIVVQPYLTGPNP